MGSPPDTSKTAKLERNSSYLLLRRANNSAIVTVSSRALLLRLALLASLLLLLLISLPHYPFASSSSASANTHRSLLSSFPDADWDRLIRRSAAPHRDGGISVLVTGAAGFVGFHCSLALKGRGDGVVGLDNFNPYYSPSLKRARQSVLAGRGVHVVDGDINDAPLLASLFRAAPFTHVLHLAAQAGVRYALANPQSYVSSNVAGLVSLLEAAARAADPQPAVVWASSSSVYGLNSANPFSESHRTDRPASLYAATKKAGEEIAHVYNHIYGLSITGLRFFTVYGPWGRPDMAYFSFAKDILDGKPITVYQLQDAAGNKKDAARDFTYIDDVVRGCLGALDTAGKSTGAGGKKRAPAPLRIYNLGNTSPVPVSKMVSILEELLGKKAKKKVVKMPGNGDVPFTHANVSLAHHDFGYQPTTDLAAGLRKFVRWYLEYNGVGDKVKEITGGNGGSPKMMKDAA